jgi:hypothetical protein
VAQRRPRRKTCHRPLSAVLSPINPGFEPHEMWFQNGLLPSLSLGRNLRDFYVLVSALGKIGWNLSEFTVKFQRLRGLRLIRWVASRFVPPQ